jgi:hypothetical protein
MSLSLKSWAAASAGVCMIATGIAAVALSAGTASATVGHHPRPVAHAPASGTHTDTSYPTSAFQQLFKSNTTTFCPAGSGNAPCDGIANDYGTIDRVSSGFSDGGSGNYAPTTAALAGSWMAVVDGDEVGNQGAGCPGTTATSNPGETCSGPYALFGSGLGEGAENVFPSNGFTVTSDIYLSPTTAAPAGSLVDSDVGLNNNAGTYGADNIITACYESGGFVVNFGASSPGSCTGSPVITTDGWYQMVWVFSNVAGNAFVTMNVLSEPGATRVATSGPEPEGGTTTPILNWGGPGYFWFPTEDFGSLPVGQFAEQLGQHKAGETAKP